MLSFFPRGVLDKILNLIESVSEGVPSFSCFTPYNVVKLFSSDNDLLLSITSQIVDLEEVIIAWSFDTLFLYSSIALNVRVIAFRSDFINWPRFFNCAAFEV